MLIQADNLDLMAELNDYGFSDEEIKSLNDLNQSYQILSLKVLFISVPLSLLFPV